jgi:hypothetical protein
MRLEKFTSQQLGDFVKLLQRTNELVFVLADFQVEGFHLGNPIPIKIPIKNTTKAISIATAQQKGTLGLPHLQSVLSFNGFRAHLNLFILFS